MDSAKGKPPALSRTHGTTWIDLTVIVSAASFADALAGSTRNASEK
ncbi:MAG: hypothetical protein IPN32_38630 [Deltaproteobacteria bacterium]|nr:hypothetical protein [Deltaproteobacteria bacterium]